MRSAFVDVRIESFADAIHNSVRSVTHAVKTGGLKDKSNRVKNSIYVIVNDTNNTYNVNSITKTSAALMTLGATKYGAMFTDDEYQKLDDMMREHTKTEATAITYNSDTDLKVLNAQRNIYRSMSGCFSDVFNRSFVNSESCILHYYPVPYLIESVKHLTDLGFKKSQPFEFLTLMAVYDTQYAGDRGIDDAVGKVIEYTVDNIRSHL